MKIEHIALYVNDLEVLSGPRTTGDGYYESCVPCGGRKSG